MSYLKEKKRKKRRGFRFQLDPAICLQLGWKKYPKNWKKITKW